MQGRTDAAVYLHGSNIGKYFWSVGGNHRDLVAPAQSFGLQGLHKLTRAVAHVGVACYFVAQEQVVRVDAPERGWDALQTISQSNADIVLERREQVLALNERALQFEEDEEKTAYVEVETGPQQYERREIETASRTVAAATAIIPLALADVLAALSMNVRMI